MEPGVYLIKERTVEDHELHKVFDGTKWYFGAAGVAGALQVADMGVQAGEFDAKGPSKPPLRIEVLSQTDSLLLAAIVKASKGIDEQEAPELGAAFLASAILTRAGENLIKTVRSERTTT